MTFAVEAGSLANVIELAGRPPLNASDIKLYGFDPLTLYITRVPGSRDVFLTPLKPRDRVVTAQDIESALYYVHYNSANDVQLFGEDEWHASEHETPSQQARVDEAPALPSRRRDTSIMISDLAPALPPRTGSIRRKPVATAKENARPTTVPVLPPRPLPPIPPDDQESEQRLRHSTQIQTSAARPQDDIEGVLTLIRREPASAAQWNVASIEDLPASLSPSRTFDSIASHRVKKGGLPIKINILNPAYFDFSAESQKVAPSTGTAARQTLESPVSRGFTRLLYLPRRTDSGDSIASLEMRKNGYQFHSPWRGICQFTSSATGKALICKHSLGVHTDEISELRFNLPTTSVDVDEDRRRQSYLGGDKRHSRLDAFRSLAQDLLTEDSGIDLSLGAERAGGGFGGRQPKLGKLIIHPPGLAMLDLLVAANIGLWWRAWEKVS